MFRCQPEDSEAQCGVKSFTAPLQRISRSRWKVDRVEAVETFSGLAVSCSSQNSLHSKQGKQTVPTLKSEGLPCATIFGDRSVGAGECGEIRRPAAGACLGTGQLKLGTCDIT